MKLQYFVGCILAADSSLVFPEFRSSAWPGGGDYQGSGGHSLGGLRADGDPARQIGNSPHTCVSGLGSVALRRRRYLDHRQNRSAAGAIEFRPAALRGRLPIQPGALPGECGKCCSVWRRTGRASRLQRALPQRIRELSTDHEATKASHLVYIGLRSSVSHLSRNGRRAALLREADRAGRPDAGGQCLFLRAELTLVHH
jgi:hypothetical protein